MIFWFSFSTVQFHFGTFWYLVENRSIRVLQNQVHLNKSLDIFMQATQRLGSLLSSHFLVVTRSLFLISCWFSGPAVVTTRTIVVACLPSTSVFCHRASQKPKAMAYDDIVKGQTWCNKIPDDLFWLQNTDSHEESPLYDPCLWKKFRFPYSSYIWRLLDVVIAVLEGGWLRTELTVQFLVIPSSFF